MDQECHRSLARCLWLRVSHEIPVRILIRSEIIWRSNWGWSIYFWVGSLPRWQLAESLIYPPHKLLHNFYVLFSQHGSCLPPEQVIQERARQKSYYFVNLPWKTNTITSAFGREEYQRICGHNFKPILPHWSAVQSNYSEVYEISLSSEARPILPLNKTEALLEERRGNEILGRELAHWLVSNGIFDNLSK